jgi:hypothetical protein
MRSRIDTLPTLLSFELSAFRSDRREALLSSRRASDLLTVIRMRHV